MKIIGLEDSRNPVFNSVTGLSNISYDNSNIRSGQMATEDQIRQLWIDANDLEQRINYCCRDIVVWKSYVRVVAENTGIVMSDWLDNVAVGTTRRGIPFTIDFALPHDSNKFFDDRSNYAIRNPPNNNMDGNFHIVLNLPGQATNLQNEFTTKAIGLPRDDAYSTGAFNSGTWRNLNSSYYIQIMFPDYLINGEPQKPLPYISQYDGLIREGYYYVYKDSTDNKLKIDVKRRDQFANGEYLALFFTQFVLRSGVTL